MKKTTLPLAVAMVFAAAGAAQAACEVTLSADIQPILDMNCVACHQDAAPGADLTVQSGSTHTATVGVPSTQVADLNLIEPGDLEASYFYLKLIDAHEEAGGFGAPMPFGGRLTDEQLDLIANWIEDCEAADE